MQMNAKRNVGAQVSAKAVLPQTIDAYIADFPPDVQQRLQTVRRAILKAAPGAVEGISYRIPAFSLGGYFIYFAGFKEHVGMYPARVAALEQELAAYGGGKGTVQFPHDEPLPLKLIAKIVKHRVAQQRERVAAKQGGAAKASAAKAKPAVKAKSAVKRAPQEKVATSKKPKPAKKPATRGR
jgi:uncharacterized protein YdhG (YjbR/CyaY superfamily)